MLRLFELCQMTEDMLSWKHNGITSHFCCGNTGTLPNSWSMILADLFFKTSSSELPSYGVVLELVGKKFICYCCATSFPYLEDYSA